MRMDDSLMILLLCLVSVIGRVENNNMMYVCLEDLLVSLVVSKG